MQERNIPESRGNSDRAETNSVRHIRFSIETDRVREIAHEEQTENSKRDGDSKGRGNGVKIPECTYLGAEARREATRRKGGGRK